MTTDPSHPRPLTREVPVWNASELRGAVLIAGFGIAFCLGLGAFVYQPVTRTVERELQLAGEALTTVLSPNLSGPRLTYHRPSEDAAPSAALTQGGPVTGDILLGASDGFGCPFGYAMVEPRLCRRVP